MTCSSVFGVYQLQRGMSGSLVATRSTVFTTEPPTVSVCCLVLGMMYAVGLSSYKIS